MATIVTEQLWPIYEVPDQISDWPKVPQSHCEDTVVTTEPIINGAIPTPPRVIIDEEQQLQNSPPEQANNNEALIVKDESADISKDSGKTSNEKRWSKLARRLTLQTKAPWPNPQLSLGGKCDNLGANECWEAVGPAQEVFSKLAGKIGAILDTRVDELEEGELMDGNPTTFGMYMIGKTPATARPTVLFTCQSANPRQRAVKFVKEAAILKEYPGIALAGSSTTPLATGRRFLRLLAGLSQSDKIALGVSIPLGGVIIVLLSMYWFCRRRRMDRRYRDESSIPPYIMRPPQQPHKPVAQPQMSYHGGLISEEQSYPFDTNQINQHHASSTGGITWNPPNTYYSGPIIGELDSPQSTGEVHLVSNHPISIPAPIQKMQQSPAHLVPIPAPSRPAPIPSHALSGSFLAGADTTTHTPGIANVGAHLVAGLVPRGGRESAEQVAHNSQSVSEDNLASSDYGTPIVCLLNGKRATVGGSVYINGSYYGLTVGHIFDELFPATAAEQMAVPPEIQEDDFEFASDDDYPDSLAPDGDYEESHFQAYISSIAITSQGSVPSSQSTAITSTTGTSGHDKGLQFLKLDPLVESRIQSEKKVVWPTISSTSGKDLGLDWAMLKIDGPSITNDASSVTNRWLGSVTLPRKVSSRPLKETEVVVVTGHSGVLTGRLSPSITMMRFSPGSKFQEVWGVRLSGNIKEGDSGSWVFDFVSGDLYGHIVAGVPEGSIVYIIPAYKVFEDVEQAMGGRLFLDSDSRP